jgi:hypothetical protein
MELAEKPYVQLSVDAVAAVVLDTHSRFDAELHDRYATFDEARNAALCCVEVMLHEEEYDDEEHRRELEQMLEMLETAESYRDLERNPVYQDFLHRLETPQASAA